MFYPVRNNNPAAIRQSTEANAGAGYRSVQFARRFIHPAGISNGIYHRRLPTGLRLYIAPLPATETASVLVLVRAGSKYEARQNNGVSHFLEHMFFKGTTKRPTPLAITETLDRVGGDYNAFTDKERTGYWAKVDAKHLELAVDLVSDMLIDPLLKVEEIAKEKGVIQQEISMYNDTPMSHIGNVFEALLYSDQPAGWEIAGTKKNVTKLKRADFLKYLNDRYVAEETVVVVAGNVNIPRTEKMIKQYFAPLRRGKAPPKKKVKEAQARPGIKIQTKDTDQTHFQLGVRTFNAFDKRRYPLALLATILGGNMSSRLFESLRGKHGLAYYVSSQPEYYSDTGYFVTQAGVPNKNVAEAVKIVMDEYATIRRQKITADELQKAKDFITGKMLIGLESSNALAAFIGDQALMYGEVKTVSEILQKIKAVTINDMYAVAQFIFKNNRLNLALIGPGENKNKLQRVLEFKD